MQTKNELVPKKDNHEHRVEMTAVGVEAAIPGYSIRFFVTHETVTDSVRDEALLTQVEKAS